MQGPPTSVPQLLPFVPDPVVLEPPKVQRDLPAPGAVPVALCRRSTPGPVARQPKQTNPFYVQRAAPNVLPTA